MPLKQRVYLFTQLLYHSQDRIQDQILSNMQIFFRLTPDAPVKRECREDQTVFVTATHILIHT